MRHVAVMVAVMLCVLIARPTRAQETDSVAAAPTKVGTQTRTAVAGEQYRAGAVHRFLLGSDYRNLWTTPIQVPVLDMNTFAGGLHPTRRVGGQQTHGLGLRGADGKDYTFRGLDKDPSDILPPELHGTIVDRVLQDQIASSFPAGSVAVAPLLRAAGVLHTEQTLVVLPDDPLLGDFRNDFAGRLGTIEEFPNTPKSGAPGTFGAVEILNGADMWTRLDESPATRADSKAFLRARLIDILIGDWDRHRGQWRWARIPGHEKMQPIPEDRDQAFVRFEGLIINAGQVTQPQFVSFKEKYPDIAGLTWNGRDVDRRILVDLDKATWMEIARDVQARITNDVIAEAVARIPREYQAIEGEKLEATLRARRDTLPAIAEKFYRFLARNVDIRMTDEAELVTVTHGENRGVEVTVALAPSRGESAPPYLRRVFHRDETDEVRLYLGGGADSVLARGDEGDIIVRVIGGDGADFVDDSGGAKIRVSDADPDTRAIGVENLDPRPYTAPARETAPWIPPRDWGRRTIWYPFIGGNTDIGVLFLLGMQTETYGFRKDPYAERHTFRIGYATGAGGFGGDYSGEFRRENSRSYSGLYVRASGLDFLHYYGFGNETSDAGDEDFYKVKQSLYRVEPSYTAPVVGSWMGTLRANVTYARTKLEPNQFISVEQPYGAENFLQAGVGAGIELDTRDSEYAPMSGVHVAVDGTVFPEAWDVAETFGEVHGDVAYYQPISILSTPTLAMRAGGKQVWGTYPYHEAAYVGGGRTVRGFAQQRFAGDASVYGNVELRVPIARIYIFVPGHLGIFGLADTGRVYLDGESSDKWHFGAGGGLWCSFLNAKNTASFSVANSEEGTRVYLIAGLAF